MRHRDSDARIFDTPLQRALHAILPQFNMLPDDLRNRLTTRSFDIPVLNATVMDDTDRTELAGSTLDGYNALRTTMTPAQAPVEFFNPLTQEVDPVSQTLTSTSLVELALQRLNEGQLNGGSPLTGAALDAFLNRQLPLLLPPEIRDGKRLM